jgi:diacylglycerol kinase
MTRYLRELAASFRCAARGVRIAGHQRNFRIMLIAALVVVALAAVLDVSATQWAILLVCNGVVLSGELLNTSIETLADRVEPGTHPAIRDTKDAAAAAVLILSAFAALTGIIVFWPYIIG